MPSDSKREEFRKYLDRTGIMDALTKALVKLYEEEERPGPDDAVTYVLRQLGGVKSEEYEHMVIKVNELEERLKILEPESIGSTHSKVSSHASKTASH